MLPRLQGLIAGHKAQRAGLRGLTSPSQQALRGTIPTPLTILHCTKLTVDLPLRLQGSLHDEKCRREDTLRSQQPPVGSATVGATTRVGADQSGSDRICHV
jgi:hypothetical protein